ncbi:MAG: NAD(P)/FAD-dependent oxidoreductase [Anaerolineales bacterium]|nr:NAD(P)/FAD-dependent oxidoreductase [Anaerolineales bacterium]MDW8162703.1 NAD(P)/FAD-dependent oxidoreductase [Anaerolineales bacterium]
MAASAHYDVIIVGAGPAGLSTALHLLQLDPRWSERMLVLEKAVHPRFKLCGGAVTRLGLKILQGLGLPLPLPIPYAYVREVHLKYEHRVVVLHGKPQLLVFERAVLDEYLAREAQARGAKLCQGEPLREIEFTPDGVALQTERASYSATVVVGADGSNGLIHRWARRKRAKARIARTLEGICSASLDPEGLAEGVALFDFTWMRNGLQGYGWKFPFPGGGETALSCGLYDARLATHLPLSSLPRLFHAAFPLFKAPSEAWQGHPIHRFSPRNRFAFPHLVLVGDTAGVDPLFGEGIGPALAYGQLAARAIHRAFERRDFSFVTYRSLLKRSYLGRYLMVRWFTAEVCYRMAGRSWFPPLVWQLGNWLARLFPQPKPLFSR